MIIRLLMPLCLLIADMAIAQSGLSNSQRSGAQPHHTVVGTRCRPGSPYYAARQKGRDAYADRHNGDLVEVLVENRPELVDLYGQCVEALNMLDSLSTLFNPSIYVNLISLQALKELIHTRVVDALCEEIKEYAEEIYGSIADVIPLGEYVYDLDDVFNMTGGS